MGGELVASMAGRVAPERVMCVALADCLGHRRGLRPLGLGCLAVVPQLCQRHTHHSFGSDTASHAGDQFAAHQAARSAFSWNFLDHSV